MSKKLVVAPHSDDETLGCFGLMYDSLKAGDEISLVIVHNGDKGDPENGRFNNSEELSQARELETINAMNLLPCPIPIYFFRVPDEEMNEIFVRRSLKSIISIFKPDVIYSPAAFDAHCDHRETYTVVREVSTVPIMQFLIHFTLDGFWPDAKNKILVPPMGLESNAISVSLSQLAQTAKIKAILSYKTQLHRKYMMSFAKINELFYEDSSYYH